MFIKKCTLGKLASFGCPRPVFKHKIKNISDNINSAGIRDNEEVGKVEEIGIEYSKQSAQEADLVLFLYDISTGMKDEDQAILDLIKDKKNLVIANKSDLTDQQAFKNEM